MSNTDIYTFKLTGVTCNACTRLIEKRLSKFPEILSINFSDDLSSVNITSQSIINKESINLSLEGTPYSVKDL